MSAAVSQDERHPGWDFKPESRMRELFIKCHANKFGTEPTYCAVHAGLECGLFCKNLGDIDGISIGPNSHDIHTPDERLELQSLADCLDIVVDMLKLM